MMFLLGRHAMFGHEPPMYFRSTTATRFPSAANVQAATVEPVPPPRIKRSYSSGCVFWNGCEGKDVSWFFMPRFLSERRCQPAADAPSTCEKHQRQPPWSIHLLSLLCLF